MSGEAITHDGRDWTPTGPSTRPEVCDCGHAPQASGIVGGYASMPDGRTLCNDCTTAAEIAAFNEPETDRAFAYLTRGRKGTPDPETAPIESLTIGDTLAMEIGLSRPIGPQWAALRKGEICLTTWTDGMLAYVTSVRAEKRYTPSGGRYDVTYFRAIDALGRRWYGTSPGLGMYARMRRAKGSP